MEKVINLVINQVEILTQRLGRLEYITETYHEYKKEKDDFIKYLDKRIEKDNKNRDGDSTRDDRQQKISESEGGDSKSDEGGKKKRKMIMKVYEILSRILSKNEWGIFFKGEPIEGFPTQDGMKMYKVNEVALDRLHDAVEKEITQMERECQGDSEQQTGGESSIG